MATKKTAKKASAEKLFEGYERREAKILAALKPYGIKSILECRDICKKAGIDPYKIVEETQPICFENAIGVVLRTLTRGSTPPFTATLVVRTRLGSVSSVSP